MDLNSQGKTALVSALTCCGALLSGIEFLASKTPFAG